MHLINNYLKSIIIISCFTLCFSCSKEDGYQRIQYSYPNWSPKGDMIAFFRTVLYYDKEGPLESQGVGLNRVESAFCISDLHGNIIKEIKNLLGNHFDWCGVNNKIAYSLDGIYVMNSDGSENTLLVADGYYPSWSVDGTEIGYKEVGTGYLVVINVTSKVKKYIKQIQTYWDTDTYTEKTNFINTTCAHPCWAKSSNIILLDYLKYVSTEEIAELQIIPMPTYTDGIRVNISGDNKIIYSVYHTGYGNGDGLENWIINLDGSGNTKLANAVHFPKWSPNNTMIIGWNEGIWIMNNSGSYKKQLF